MGEGRKCLLAQDYVGPCHLAVPVLVRIALSGHNPNLDLCQLSFTGTYASHKSTVKYVWITLGQKGQHADVSHSS